MSTMDIARENRELGGSESKSEQMAITEHPAAESGRIEDISDADSDKEYLLLGITPNDLQKASAVAQTLSLDEARQILIEYVEDYAGDMLVPISILNHVRSLISPDSEKTNPVLANRITMTAAVLSSNSAYREIRAAFRAEDDVDALAGTVRAWTIGIIWSVGIASINQFFHPRSPAITLSTTVAQMFAFPMGRILAKVLPNHVWLTGTAFEFNLNPGPWSIKEQTLVTIMASATATVPLIMDIIFVQRLPIFLGQEFAGNFGYQLCILLSTQLLGYSLAGFTRRYLVYPPAMIWFSALSQGVLNESLFSAGNDVAANGWKITRIKFFGVAFTAMFLYFWLPNTIFPTLTYFNWITWIAPTNAIVSIVTGSYYFNLGMNPWASFDWNWFATIDPLLYPLPIVAQMVAATFIWGTCVILPVFFSNVFWTGYLPINSFLSYANNGHPYSPKKVMDSNFQLDIEKYKAYSPVFLSAASTLRYAVLFVVLLSSITFSILWYGKPVWKSFRQSLQRKGHYAGRSDIHSRLMSQYPECPEYVFIALGVVSVALGFAAIYGWPTNVNGWTIPLCLLLSIFFIIPFGLIAAVSSYYTDLEILFTIIGGYISEGNPVAVGFFRLFGECIIQQCIAFTADMKLGHYAKLPPRTMVAGQIVATVLAAFATLGVANFQMNSIDGICDTTVELKWICSGANTQFSALLQWGLIGPRRLFAPGALYAGLPYAFIGGLLWPVPWYLAKKRWPNSWVRTIHPMLLLLGGVLWAPINFTMIWPSLPFSIFFGWYIKTRYLPWWSKYALVLSCALSSGIAISALVQFFAIQYPEVVIPDWWGTTQYASTCDFSVCTWLKLPTGGTFGPTEWS